MALPAIDAGSMGVVSHWSTRRSITDGHERAAVDCASAQLADALWDGVRHEPGLPSGGAGWRGWYLTNVYAGVARRRRDRVWQHRSPEPWLSAQILMDRAGGGRTKRSALRWEGFPGQISYEAAYAAVRAGQFTRPYLFVAGYSRTGTTSLQNVVMAAFPDHLQPGRWNDPDRPLWLWWYPKHQAHVARRVAGIDPSLCRVLVTVRRALPSMSSLAVHRGFERAQDVPASWISTEADDWQAMATVAALPGAHAVPFEFLTTSSPAELVDSLQASLGITPVAGAYREASWPDLHLAGVSPDVIDSPRHSNLPHAERVELPRLMAKRIAQVLGPRLDDLDGTYTALTGQQ